MKKVIVGLSGGVDSAVAAYLLKKQGYEVVGAFMRNWDSMLNNDVLGNPNNEASICPQEQDYNDALKVANKLGIPLLRVDFVKEYWDNVFTYFINEYKAGRTPNPDVLCNKYIKFDAFLKFALENGADYIATGHYAKIKDGSLYKAYDDNKDQSYFLCMLNKNQIAKSIFPLDSITKPEVRKIAAELGLEVADKKDSTGVCFIGERNFRLFLQNYIPAKQGNIVELPSKKVVGTHNGCMYYTIGQRKGLGIGGIKDHESGSFFVCGKDVANNVLYVTQNNEDFYLYKENVEVVDINNLEGLSGEVECFAKFRYRQKDIKVKIKVEDDKILVKCLEKARATTVGQFAVFYDENGKVLASGIINKVY